MCQRLQASMMGCCSGCYLFSLLRLEPAEFSASYGAQFTALTYLITCRWLSTVSWGYLLDGVSQKCCCAPERQKLSLHCMIGMSCVHRTRDLYCLNCGKL
ncbi:hypothetical protein ABBQ38_004486 [Trebouxia sp. C0009 RCD-2024]